MPLVAMPLCYPMNCDPNGLLLPWKHARRMSRCTTRTAHHPSTRHVWLHCRRQRTCAGMPYTCAASCSSRASTVSGRGSSALDSASSAASVCRLCRTAPTFRSVQGACAARCTAAAPRSSLRSSSCFASTAACSWQRMLGWRQEALSNRITVIDSDQQMASWHACTHARAPMLEAIKLPDFTG